MSHIDDRASKLKTGYDQSKNSNLKFAIKVVFGRKIGELLIVTGIWHVWESILHRERKGGWLFPEYLLSMEF